MRKEADRPMRLMIDTNIVMDILMEREPFFSSSYLVLRNMMESGDMGMITASSVTDIYYLMRRMKVPAERAKEAIRILLDDLKAADVGQKDIIAALSAPVKDFEDAVVAAVAKRSKADYIITRNKKDFEGSDPAALTPDEYLELIGVEK